MKRTLLVGLVAALVACRPSKSPIAALDVSTREIHLAWPQSTEIELGLVPSAPLPKGVDHPILFVHLLDEPGSVVRTFDHELRGAWKPGAELRDRHRIFQSALAAPLPAGHYLLTVGLYDLQLGRFALSTRAPEITQEEYQVATVEVPTTSAAGPEAHFSGDWLAPEPSSDRQVVASRRLRGGAPGTIGFGPLAGPGTIFLGLVVPGASGTGSRLELNDGALQPKVKVSSSCGGQQSEVTGTGRFDFELQVPAAAPPASCEVVIEPNFVISLGDRAETISIRLEELSYRPGAGGDS